MSQSLQTCEKLFSIGAVSQMTGISVFTLRMWQRRYCSPVSHKLDSGHRRFATAEIDRLKLVKQAVDAGAKASVALTLSDGDLKKLIGGETWLPWQQEAQQRVTMVIEQVLAWDDQAIYRGFESDWQLLGPIGFVCHRAAPLLDQIGISWARGILSVGHEHFMSRILERFLYEKWATQLDSDNKGRVSIVLAGLDQELHCFGLHFCAVAAVSLGVKVVYLGAATPASDILAVAQESQSSVVGISVSSHYDPKRAIQNVKSLRSGLPSSKTLVIGGKGAPAQIPGVLTMANILLFSDWLKSTLLPGSKLI